MKEITVGQFLDAIGQNGLPKAKGSYYFHEGPNGEISHGCAYGQAALNLEVSPVYLRQATMKVSWKMQNEIIRLNDYTDLGLPEIAIAIRNMYKPGFLKRKLRV